MCARQITASRQGGLSSLGLPAIFALLLAIFALCSTSSSWALGPRGSGFHPMSKQYGSGGHGTQQSHPAPAPQTHPSTPQARPSPSHSQEAEPPLRPAVHSGSYLPSNPNVQPGRPGQQHLPEWLNNHQNLSPQQQEDALRREPGFRGLPTDQQQRLVNRLHSLDEKTPEQRQRILARNENFERLPPEQRQEVRGASQALGQMSPDRQQLCRRAFQQLRQLPPQQRQLMLNSGSYASQFTPQERTVLGNLLSIEPYQAHPGAIPQPYFGR